MLVASTTFFVASLLLLAGLRKKSTALIYPWIIITGRSNCQPALSLCKREGLCLYRVTCQLESYILLQSIWGVPLACLGSS